MGLETPTTPWRVKVYELMKHEWVDRGTGYCTGEITSDQPYLMVRSEDDHKEVILKSKIGGYTQYQKQQDTLIVWSEPNNHNNDMALSFQEVEGCSLIIEFLAYVQNQIIPEITIVAIISGGNEGDISELIAGPITYPPEPSLGNLTEVIESLGQTTTSQFGRDSVLRFIHETDFLSKIIALYELAEDLENIEGLHDLCRIMKMLSKISPNELFSALTTTVLLNDSSIFETVLKDQFILGVVGILECKFTNDISWTPAHIIDDPEYPKLKANHRVYLTDESNFKEVIPISEDKIRDKINQTFRLQFLKDVVLARLLDDSTISLLSSMIYYNQKEIVMFLQNSEQFVSSLFYLYSAENRDSSLAQLRNGVRFVHQITNVAKGLQSQQKCNLYKRFTDGGLFALIKFALEDEMVSIRILGIELIVSVVDHDPVLIRNSFQDPSKINEGTSLINALSRLLLSDKDVGLRSQAAEAIRVILDPSCGSADNLSALGGELSSKMEKFDEFLTIFYGTCASFLFGPLAEISKQSRSKSEMVYGLLQNSFFENECDLLSFCIRFHGSDCRDFVVHNNLFLGVSELTNSSKKQIKLAAIRCIKQGVIMEEELYSESLIASDALGSVLNLMLAMGNKNNLLNSSCLELFNILEAGTQKSGSQKALQPLLNHLFKRHFGTLISLSYSTAVSTLIKHCHSLKGEGNNLFSSSVYVKDLKSVDQINNSYLFDTQYSRNMSETEITNKSEALAKDDSKEILSLVDYSDSESDQEQKPTESHHEASGPGPSLKRKHARSINKKEISKEGDIPDKEKKRNPDLRKSNFDQLPVILSESIPSSSSNSSKNVLDNRRPSKILTQEGSKRLKSSGIKRSLAAASKKIVVGLRGVTAKKKFEDKFT